MRIGAYAYKTCKPGQKNVEQGLGRIVNCNSEYRLDVLVAPEYSFRSVPNPQRLRTLSQRAGGMLLIPGSMPFREGEKIFNQVRVYQDGILVHQYEKRSKLDIPGYAPADHFEYVPGKNTFSQGYNRGIKKLGNLNLGIEICADHMRGVGTDDNPKPVLRHDLESRPDLGQLDLQIVVACGLAGINTEAMITKENGACLLVDGSEVGNGSHLLVGTAQHNREVQPERTLRVNASPDGTDLLRIYEF